MSSVTNIFLTANKSVSQWQSDNLLQIIDDDIYIYLDDNDLFPLQSIQKAGRSIEKMGVKNAHLQGDSWKADSQWAFALGFTCVDKLTNIEFNGDEDVVSKLNDKLAVYAWSRDLTNQTPSQLTPLLLAEKAQKYITTQAPEYVKTHVISGEALSEQGWTGVYNVGKGSVNPPCIIEIDYNPTGDDQAAVTACLVGKGITFDSGGYSLKSNEGMFHMKCDMGGAAVVAGALALAIRQGLKSRVKLILCCAENMVSNNAYKLGDILTYKNGVTCEVANTDAEGRIVLADGLLMASENSPTLIIDAATLTGAAVAATGGDYTALFSLDQQAADQAKKAATSENEPLWQLPLAKWHQDKCPSAFANTANSRPIPGGGPGGASNAAGFLSRFVDGKGWLHFDLAAAYNGSANAQWGAGATGLSIATIANLLLSQ
ncbi:aminopeptidase PepB [Thalassotalea piscium]|uniref:PepB aminopeptidase n=1 Tax=Thalassotalea piscium TaxID=1230533 RepID=A0A7X0NJK7_9GAMM|nr:aminopeptidase PepB [Thalassotalea piscium]MBB6544644.1 PepB aminopeptidase [Thalassotalea piscium]